MKKIILIAMLIYMCLLSLFFENAFADFSLPYTYNGHQYSDVLDYSCSSDGYDWHLTIYYNPIPSVTSIRYTPYQEGVNPSAGVSINGARSALIITQAAQFNGGNPRIQEYWNVNADSYVSCGVGCSYALTIDTSKLYSSENILDPNDDNVWFYANVSRGSTAIKLPDTGQTTCYDSSGTVIDCAGTGQDGAYNINPMSFTDNGNGTVTDNNTGLMWQKQDDGNTYNWYQASGTYDATYNPNSQDVCGSLSLGDHSDWRLPTKKELISIVDYSILYPGPTIDTTYFPNTNSSFYWSSITFAYNPSFAWDVDFSNGFVYFIGKYGSYGIRCVRDGQFPDHSFVDNGDGTVTDNNTGLMWQKQDDGNTYNWYQASGTYDATYNPNSQDVCGSLSLGDHSDWRLPNVKELESITDDTRWSPAIDTAYFPNTHSSCFWSSTTFASFPSYAWLVDFDLSYVGAGGNFKYYNYYYVRCVRGGLTPQACTYTYSDWGACQPDNTQTRTVLTATPEGCTGTPVLSQSCNYVPPAYGNLEVSPSSYDFGEVLVGECDLQLFTLKNSGNANLNVSGISLTDTTNYDFDRTIIYACATDGQTITPGDLCNVVVKFCPSTSGSFNAGLAITSNDPDTPTYNVPITGIAHTMFKFSEPQPPAGSVIKQEMNPLNLLSAAGLIKATVNSGSTYRLNLLQKLLARWNLNPITHSVVICSKGSEIDWTKLQVIINGDDVTSDALTLQYPSSSECDSKGKVILQKYWINEDVDIKVVIYAVDGTTDYYEWEFSVETKWLWPMIKDSAKSALLGPLNKIVDILEGVFLPIRGTPD